MGNAFRRFTEVATESDSGSELFKVAFHGGTHEATITNIFTDLLRTEIPPDIDIFRNKGLGYSYVHDIVLKIGQETLAVVEAKAPFTNHDGVRNKSKKDEHLPKDHAALRIALEHGASAVFEFVVLIECYAIDSHGNAVVLDGRSLKGNEQKLKSKFKMQWPTRFDYSASSGEQQVDSTLRGFGMVKAMGWDRIQLPSTRKHISAYLDCALYSL